MFFTQSVFVNPIAGNVNFHCCMIRIFMHCGNELNGSYRHRISENMSVNLHGTWLSYSKSIENKTLLRCRRPLLLVSLSSDGVYELESRDSEEVKAGGPC